MIKIIHTAVRHGERIYVEGLAENGDPSYIDTLLPPERPRTDLTDFEATGASLLIAARLQGIDVETISPDGFLKREYIKNFNLRQKR